VRKSSSNPIRDATFLQPSLFQAQPAAISEFATATSDLPCQRPTPETPGAREIIPDEYPQREVELDDDEDHAAGDVIREEDDDVDDDDEGDDEQPEETSDPDDADTSHRRRHPQQPLPTWLSPNI